MEKFTISEEKQRKIENSIKKSEKFEISQEKFWKIIYYKT